MRNRIQHLQCPFCPATSIRGTGLSAHIRARHAKQYKSWNRNPDRLVEASGAAPAQSEEPEADQRVQLAPGPLQVVESLQPADQPPADAANGHEPLSLLQKVHDQLAARKDGIEFEIARIEALRSEHESVITQLAAIDQAMSAFRRPDEGPGR